MRGFAQHFKYLLSALFVLCTVVFSPNFAFAAGDESLTTDYTCGTEMYTGCKSGYFMSYGTAGYGPIYDATPKAGNTCSPCPDGYTCAGGTAAPTITCAAGTRVVSAGAKCTTPSGGWWTASSHTVNYGQVSLVNYCMAGYSNSFTSAIYHKNGTYCRKDVAGASVANTIPARYIKVTSSGSSVDSSKTRVVEIQAFASVGGIGPNLLSGKSGPTGANISNATDGSWTSTKYAEGSSSNDIIWDMGAIKDIGSIKFALFTDGRTYNNVTISVSTSNTAVSTWTTVLGPISVATQNVTTATGELVRLKGQTPCLTGAYAASSTVALTGTKSCSSCAAGTYSSVTGRSACTPCETGSYNTAMGSSSCTPCQNGTTTSGTGQTSCNATCTYAANTKTWQTSTWSPRDTNNYFIKDTVCAAETCKNGYTRRFEDADKGVAAFTDDCAYPVPITIHYQCDGMTDTTTKTCYINQSCPLDYTGCSKTGYTQNGWYVEAVQSDAYGSYPMGYDPYGDGMFTYLAEEPNGQAFWDNGAHINVKAQYELSCVEIEVEYARQGGVEYAYYYAKPGKVTQLYSDDECTVPTTFAMEYFGDEPYSSNKGVYDVNWETGELNESCVDASGNLTGNCVVDEQYESWESVLTCGTGFTGSGTSDKDIWGGDVCNAIPITINYLCDGENVSATKTCYIYEDSCKLDYTGCTKTGHTLAEWFVDADGYDDQNVSSSSVPDLIADGFIARQQGAFWDGGAVISVSPETWDQNEYTVIYVGNKPSTASGAISGSTENSIHKYDEPKALTTNGYSLTGWTFAGWNTKADGTGTSYADKASVKNLATLNGSGVPLYAQWTPNTYKITLNNQGATTAGTTEFYYVYDTGKYYADQGLTTEITKITTPTKTGYTFLDYEHTPSGGASAIHGDGTITGSYFSTQASDTTLYAQWSVNTYTVSFDQNGGTGGQTSSVTATYGNAMPAISAVPTRTGYTFTGYYDAKSGGKKYYNADKSSANTWNKTANTTLYAQWSANTSTVSFDQNGGTGGQTSSVTATYGSAMPAISAVPTRTGYTFTGYYDAKTGGNKYYNADKSSARTWNKTSNTTLYAQWTIISKSCAAGTYLPAGATVCQPCKAGYYCEGGTYSYKANADQGLTGKCENGTYAGTGQSTCTTCPTPRNTIGAAVLNPEANQDLNENGVFESKNECGVLYIFVEESVSNESFITDDKYYQGNKYNPNSEANKRGNAYVYCSYNASTDEYDLNCYGYPVGCAGGYYSSGYNSDTHTEFLENGIPAYRTDTLSEFVNVYCEPVGANYWSPAVIDFESNTDLYNSLIRYSCPAKSSTNGSTTATSCTCNTGYNYNGGTTATTTACSANTIKIAYAGNSNTGGSAPTSPTTCSYNSDCNAPSNTYTRTGYSFTGWKCTGGGTSCDGDIISAGGSIKNATTTHNGTITLTAQWTACTYSVKYNSNKPSAAKTTMSGSMSNSSHTYNTSKALTSNAFTLPGYTFAGWNTKADGTGTSYSNGASVKNLTSTCSGTFNLYAQWTANTGLSCESGTYLEADTATCSSCPAGYYCTGVTSVTYNGSDQGITGVCKSGYSTGGAKTETCTACSSGYSATGTTAADHDASSDCKGNTITLAYNEDGGDSVSNGSCTYGSTFTLPSAATKDGSVFAGWKLNDGSVKSAGTSVTCNYTNLGVYSGTSTAITAQWTECGTGYWCSGGVKTACTTLGSGYTTSTTTATKNTDCYKSCTRACTQQTCPANVATCAHGTTTTSGIQYYGSTSCSAAASTCSMSFTCATGYEKNSAGTDCSVKTSYTITYALNGGTNNSSNPSSYNVETATITLANPTRSGYTFGGWYTTSNFSGSAVNEITKGSTGNKTYHAKWVECGTGYWCSGGVKTACTTLGSGYTTSTTTATKNTDCYKTCTRACTQQTCPANTETCAHGTTTTSGIQYYGSTSCSAAASTCSMSFTCKAGYEKNSAGTACTACTYTVAYNANGGSGTMSNSTHTYDTAKVLTANTFTRSGYVFLGWSTSNTATSATYADKASVKNLTSTCGGTVYLYPVWSKCASGSYCPGDNTSIECPTAYPNSAAGSDAITDCYSNSRSRPFTCTQKACANPDTTGCSGYTCASSCTCSGSACSYTVYSNSAGTGDGTHRDGCTSNNVSCTKPVASLTAKANRYVNGTSSCPACPSGYPSSDGGNKNNTYCYTSCGTGYSGRNYNGATDTCTANKYTITLNKNHNDAVAGTTALYTTYATGVYTDSARTKSMTTSANGITAPTRSYTVTYDANSGSVSTSSSTSNYTFNGYYSATSGGTQYTGSTYILAAGLTAGKGYTSDANWYAQWTGKAITLPTPTRAGYTFNGWYTAATGGTKIGAAGVSYTPTANIKLYAQWTAKTYTVTYSCGDADTGATAPSSATATYNANFTPATNTCTKQGHDFAGWIVSNTSTPDVKSSEFVWKYTENKTFTAKWTAKQITCQSGEFLNITSCKSCTAGYKCPSVEKTYTYDGSNQGRTACSGATEYQNATGQTTCKTVSDGYYKTSNSAQSVCGTGYYCKDSVRTQCPNSGTTSKTTASVITECYKTGLTYSASKGSGTQTCYYTSGSGTSAVYNSSCTSKKITSCVAGYYLKNTTDTDCSGVGSGYYSEAGDTERDECPTGYNAGSSTAGAITDCKIDCPAATYLKTAKDSTCTSADTGYWATGEVVAYGNTSTQTQCPANYRAGAGASAEQYCQTECAASTYVATAKSACTSVGGGYWSAKHNVYYGSTSTDSRNQCPENYRAGAATTSEGSCITSCADGTAVKTAKAACVAVGSGYYMESHTVFYGNKSGTIGTCPTDTAGRTVKSAAGADAKTDCYVSCGAKTISDGTASVVSSTIYYNGSSYPACTYNTSCNPGFYGADNTEKPSCTACAAGKYSAANATTCTDCAAGSYSAAGASACTACAAGTTSAKGSGTCSACSNKANVSAWDTPSWTANTTSNVCSVKTCAAGYSESNNACVACTYTVKYNANGGSGTMSSSTHTYDVAKTLTANTFTRAGYTFAGWATSTSGSVVHADKKSVSKLTTTCGGTVNLYAVWSECASGSYCPGDNTSKSCPSAYPNSAAGSDNENDCYLTTTKGNHVKAQGAGQVSCAANGYCAGGTKVWYSTGNGSATGGRTACPTAYPNSAAGSDNINDCYLTTGAGKYVKTQGAGQETCVSGNYCAGSAKVWYSTGNGAATGGSQACPELYPNSAAGASHNYECYLTTTPGNYVAEAAQGETTCESGSYCPGGIVIYYNTGKGDHLGGSAKCAVGSYASGTGNSACTVCGKGKTTTSAGSSSASACIACSNNTGVSAWETVSWTYSGVSSNSVKNLCTIDTCSAGYTLSSNACGIDTYTITYYDYDDNKTLSLSPSSYKVTSSDITLPTPFKSGKKFVSWHTDSALSESTVVNTIPKGSTGNKTFYAEWEPCPSGYACNGSSVTQCTGNTYAGAGASSCTSCPAATGWEITSAFLEQGGVTDAGGVNSDNMANRVRVKSTEMIHLNAGTYNVSFKNTSAGVTVRGFYQYSSPDDTGTFTAMKSGASLTVSSDVYVRLVFQKSNTSTAITPAEVVSAGATLNKTNAYVISGTATTNHDNVNDCKISCPSGSYVAVAGGVCVPVASGKYVAAKTVAYGSTNSVSSCPATNSGSDSGRATNKTCYYTCPSKTVSNGTATVVSSKVYYTGSAYPTCTYNVTCNKGYSASGSGTANPSCTACPYTVTYNSNKPSNASGTISGTTASSTHTYDTAKALTTNGYKLTGWTFQNWNTKADGSGITYTDGQSVKNLTATCNGTVTLYAQWKANTYTVTYNSNKPSTATATISGSTANSSHTYDTAKALTTNGYKLTGYTFKGWSTSNTATSATYADKASVKNLTATNGATVTLYAVWSANCIPVTFNMNYTDSLNPPQVVTLWKQADATGWYIDNACSASYSATANSSIILPGDVYFYDADSKEPYVFRGFYDKAHSDATNNTTIAVQYFMTDGTVSTDGANLTINSPITVYAAWATPCQAPLNGTCNLAVDTDGDTHYSASCDTGYTLSGYDTYTPSCTANAYTVKYNANGGSGTMSDQARKYNDNVALTANVFTRSGYTFKNWNTKTDGTGTTYTDKQVANLSSASGATVTLYAQWTACTYTVVYNSNKPSTATASISGTTANSTHTYDTAKALTTNGYKLTGWTFEGWSTSNTATTATYTDGQSVKNLTSTCGGTVNLYAVWSANCNKITVKPYCSGSTYNPPLYKKTDYTGWYSDSTCTTTTTLLSNVPASCNNSNGDFTLRGIYSAQTTTLSADGNTGIQYFTKSGNSTTIGMNWKVNGAKTIYLAWARDCVQPSNGKGTCELTVSDNGAVDYTTSCNSGYTISGNNTNAPVCTANPYSVTLDKNANDATAGTASVTATYDSAMPTPITLPTRAGYTFAGYYDTEATTGGTQYYTSAGASARSWNKAAATTLYARWSKCSAGSYCPGDNTIVACPTDTEGRPLTSGAGSDAADDCYVTCASTISVDNAKTVSVVDGTPNYNGSVYPTCTYNVTCNTGYTVKNNKTATPSCTANTYSIAYTLNSGTSGGTQPTTATYDKAFTVSNPTRTGYTFKGWNITGMDSVTHTYDSSTTTETSISSTKAKSYKNLRSTSGTVTFTATWTANGYAVTLDKNASDATAGTASVTATYDSAMPTPITLPTRAGYTFAGYYDTEATTGGTQYYTSAGASARSWNKAAATTLYARWKGNTITINYVENGGTELSNITCTYGESFKLPTISRSGYSFAGWAFGDTSSSESMTKFKAGATVICDYKNLKVYSGTADAQALWNIVGYAITYKDGDNEISGLTPTLYDVETEINLPTVAYKEGKKFVSWHTDSALSESTVVNTIPKGSTGDKTFYVKWEDCPAGYACNGSSVTQCTGPTYAVAGSASCSSCPSGYTYDTTKGKTKAEQCKIRCAGGSYLAKAKDASCTNVGAKYYKVAHIVNYNSASSRSACLTGLTTIGYGKGADEAGDCGRILHVDGETLYLRSAEKTDVSLHVKIGDAVFYGNMVVGTKKMSAGATKTLKIKHNGQTYSVYDDSVN